MNYNKKIGILLENAPCNQDLFEGEPHKDLADAIAKNIENEESSMIGVDGQWGSGKSNLIGIVKELLNERKGDRYFFYIYDAWNNQSDFPRRSFLKGLLNYLVKEKILYESGSKRKLENLFSKKRRTSTITIPTLGPGIISSFVAVLLTPITSCIVSSVQSPLWKAMLLCIPFAILLTSFVIYFRSTIWRSESQKIKITECWRRFFAICSDKIQSDTKYEAIYEEEPDTPQFKDWFSDIDNEFRNKGKVLVVVFDNLDRLPRVKVCEVWATILSFFAGEKNQNIRVIVPFDRSHLSRAFSDDFQDVGYEAGSQIEYVDDFINKTFSVVYYLPPLIMTGWVRYFSDKWREAFKGEDEIDDSVIQIFDKLSTEFTPRSIIAFINQFVTIRNSCDNEIEDKYIALYIMGRKIIAKDPLVEILCPTYLGVLSSLYGNDPKLPNCISSLHYRLHPGNAMDFVFVRQIKNELDEGKTDSLEKLVSQSKNWLIINRAIPDVINIENATKALGKCLMGKDSTDTEYIWDTLFKKFREKGDKDPVYKGCHAILMEHIKEKKRCFNFLLEGYHENIGDEFDVNGYVDGIDELEKYIDDNVRDCVKEFKTKISPAKYLGLIEKKKDKAGCYGLITDPVEFDEYISALPREDIALKEIYPYIKKDKWDVPKYKKRVEEFVRNSNAYKSLIVNLLNRLKEIEEYPINMSKYWDNNKFSVICSDIEKNRELLINVLAMTILKLDRMEISLTAKKTLLQHLESDDKGLAKSLAGVVLCYADYGDLLIFLPKHKGWRLLPITIMELLDDQDNVLGENFKEVLFKFDDITEVLNKPAELLNMISKCDISKIEMADIIKFSLSLLKKLSEDENDISRHCRRLIDKYLQDITEEKWHTLLLNGANDPTFNLLEVFHPTKLQPFYKAFKNLLREYAIGKSERFIPNTEVERMIKICKELKLSVKPIFKEIRDIFIYEYEVTIEKLRYLGDWLLRYGALDDRKESLGTIFKLKFLDDNDIIDILVKNTKEAIKMFEGAGYPVEFMNKMSLLREGENKTNKGFADLYNKLMPK